MKHILMGVALLASATPLMAATYTQADFNGNINPGNANVKAPFSGNGFTQGMPFSGSFVFQDDLVPATPGFTNIFFNNFADIADIPAADAFEINFGSLHFTLADNLNNEGPAGIQYKNGQFWGFVFVTNFQFSGKDYQFRANGSAISVRLLSGGFPTGSNLINAHFNQPYTGATPYTIPTVTPPTPAVPEPASWAMMIGGLGLVGAAMRRRQTGVSFA